MTKRKTTAAKAVEVDDKNVTKPTDDTKTTDSEPKIAELVEAEEKIVDEKQDKSTKSSDTKGDSDEKAEQPSKRVAESKSTDSKSSEQDDAKPDADTNTKSSKASDASAEEKPSSAASKKKTPKGSADASADEEPKGAQKANEETEDNKVDGVVVDPKQATQTPENGKNEIDTMGNIKLDETNVESRAESKGEQLQDGEEDRHVSEPGKVALKTQPQVIDVENASDSEKTEAEGEAVAGMVNDSLPNKPAPETIHETVKADAIISRAENYKVDPSKTHEGNQEINNPKVEGLGAPDDLRLANAMKHDTLLVDAKGQSTSSTESPNIDEIPVPAGEVVMSERERQVARMQESNAPILRQNSTQDLINRRTPINVFQRLAESNEARNNKTSNEQNMVQKINDKLNIDLTRSDADNFLKSIVGTLDDYARRMSPRSPIAADQMLEQQKNLTGLVANCLDSDTAVGVAGLKIVEEYFRTYSNGAFGGTYPFRAFNALPQKYADLSNVLYAIQAIARDGKKRAMQSISVQKLKESVTSREAQIVLLSYLNA